jgi:vitamin B12 transporter
MKKSVCIARPLGFAIAVICAQGFSLGAQAQTSNLGPVVITGSREPMPLSRLVGDISVIDAEQIRNSSADSIEELLRRQGGIQLSRTGGAGQSASLFLRGNSASGTVVLIDGVRVGSATLGQTDLSSLSLAQVERIEILRGPGSSLYGSDAMGGVVQIFTKRGQGSPSFTAHAAVGSDASHVVDAAFDGSVGAFDFAASLSHEGSDGVSAVLPTDVFGRYNPDADGYKRTGASLRGGFTIAPGHRIGLSVLDNRLRSQFDSAEYNPPTFTPDPSPDFRNRLNTRVVSADYRGVWSPQWVTSLQIATQRDALESGGSTMSRYDTDRQQVTAQAAWTPVAGHQLLGAVENLEEKVTANALAGVSKRRNNALVFGYTGKLDGHKLQADLRHDHNSASGNVDTGKIGWGYDLTPSLSVRAVAGTAFRAPSFNELYYPSYGVSTIRPERSRSVEVGAKWKEGDSSAGITVYENRMRDVINYEPDATKCPAGYTFGCAANIDRAKLRGATIDASHKIGNFALHATIDFLDAKEATTGTRLIRRAAHQETFGVDWSSGPLSLGATLLDVGGRPESGRDLDAYQLLDLQARYKLDTHWQLEAKLLNATDRHYEPARDYQGTGRQVWIGVRFDGLGG